MADGPSASDKYLSDVGQAELYRKGIVKAIQTGKTDRKALTDLIMGVVEDKLRLHFAGGDERHQFSRKQLETIIDGLRKEIDAAGGIDADIAARIAAQYHNRAHQISQGQYSAALERMEVPGAAKSLKEIATYHGRAEDHREIAGMKDMEQLTSKAGTYHPDVLSRAAEKVNKGEIKRDDKHLTYTTK